MSTNMHSEKIFYCHHKNTTLAFWDCLHRILPSKPRILVLSMSSMGNLIRRMMSLLAVDKIRIAALNLFVVLWMQRESMDAVMEY